MTGSVQEKKQGNKKFLYIVLSYKDEKNKWHTKWVPTHLDANGNKKQAKAMIPSILMEYEYLEAQNNDTTINRFDKNVLFCDYVRYYLKQEQLRVETKNLEQTTYENYENYVNHILHYFEPLNKKLVSITSKDVKDFVRYELTYGKENPYTHVRGPLSIRSTRSVKCVLHAIMMKALIEGYIRQDPTYGVGVGRHENSYYAKEECFMELDEAKDFLQFVKANDELFYYVVLLGTFCGLRRGELLGLKWENINFEDKYISIENNIVRAKQGTYEKAPKTKSSKRKLTLLDNLAKELLVLRSQQENDALIWGNQYDSNDYVLKWQDGHPFSPDYLSKKFKKLAKAYGRSELSLHKLRHTCCSILGKELNLPIKDVQKWLGHSDMQTTMNIYMHAKGGIESSKLSPINDAIATLL